MTLTSIPLGNSSTNGLSRIPVPSIPGRSTINTFSLSFDGQQYRITERTGNFDNYGLIAGGESVGNLDIDLVEAHKSRRQPTETDRRFRSADGDSGSGYCRLAIARLAVRGRRRHRS